MNGWLFLGAGAWVCALLFHLIGVLMVVIDDEKLFPDKLKITMVGSFVISMIVFIVVCFHLGGAL